MFCFAFDAIDASVSSELIMIIEMQRVDLIHCVHDLDPAAFQVLLVHLRMATFVLIKISTILIQIHRRMMVPYQAIYNHERLAHRRKI